MKLLLEFIIAFVFVGSMMVAWLIAHPEPVEAKVTKIEADWEKEICLNLDSYSNADEFRKHCKWRLTGEI